MKLFIVFFISLYCLNLWACPDFSGRFKLSGVPDNFSQYEIVQDNCFEITFIFDSANIEKYHADGKYYLTNQAPIIDRGNIVGTSMEYKQVAILDKGLVVNQLVQYNYINGIKETFQNNTSYSILTGGDLLLSINENGEMRFEVHRKIRGLKL